MADETYTTNLEFQTNAASQSREIARLTETVKRLEKQSGEVGKVGGNISFPGDELSRDFDLFSRAFDKTFKRVKDNLVDLRTGTKAASADVDAFAKKTSEIDLQKIVFGEKALDVERIREMARRTGEDISEELAQGLLTGELTQADLFEIEGIERQFQEIQGLEEAKKRELKTTIDAHRQKALLYAKEASLLRKTANDIRENAQILRNQAQQIQGISQLALGVGVGVAGGIFGFASKYVRDAKEATEVTIAWKEAQESLGKSGQRIGAVFAQTALPLLKLAAQAAERAAGFIEKHPELVQAALNIGIITAGIGAIGLAVSKGIKLYADQLYLSSIPLQLQAGQLQFTAAQEQLAAARLRVGTSLPGGAGAGGAIGGGAAAAGGSFLTTGLVPFIALVTASFAGSKAIASGLDQMSAKMLEVTKNAPLVTGLFKGIENGLAPLFPFIGPLRQLEQHLPQVHKLLEKLGLASQQAATASTPIGGVRGSAAFDQILKAYEDYKRDDLALVQRHYAERQQIIASSMADQARVTREYLSSVGRINSQTGRAITAATAAFEQEAIRAEQQYQQQRAQVIRDSGIEIQRIEEQLQENLRKLRQDHEDRLEDLVASRDALGIVKEQQRYNRERSELTRQANLEIRQRRQDLALRLQDMAQSYQQERAQRLQDFQARILEIRANAGEQLRELAARHYEELNQIRQQRVARLRELDAQLREERNRRYEYFVDQIRNLDAALLGEKALRKQRQDEMIAELDAFLVRYKQGMGSLLTSIPAPSNARGGYATYGMHLLGDAIGGGRGKPEYVLRGDVTELAERVLGGHITQDKMIALLNAANGGSRNNVVYNDSRRIDSRVSASDRELMIDDTLSALQVALR